MSARRPDRAPARSVLPCAPNGPTDRNSHGRGDAPGLNAVIRAVVRSAVVANIECVGIEDSFDGLIFPNRVRVLTVADVVGIHRLGGTILGTTNRGNPFAYPMGADGHADFSDRVVENVPALGLSALIVIGGDGTLAIAHEFQKRGVARRRRPEDDRQRHRRNHDDLRLRHGRGVRDRRDRPAARHRRMPTVG